MINKDRRFENWKYPEIEDGVPTKYTWIVQNLNQFELGKNTDIGAFTYINAKFGVRIDDNVQIGSQSSIYSISTIDNNTGRVHLKRNSKLGSHSTVLPGVIIGENSIIGAHSLVICDIPPNVVAFGVPAKVFKKIDK